MQRKIASQPLSIFLASAARVLATTPIQETAATKLTTIRKTPATTEDASAS